MGDNGFTSIFNGVDLTGWFATPRTYGEMWPGGPTVQEKAPDHFPADYNEQAAKHPAVWTVEDGVIVGRQDSPGSGWGGYLVTERKYGDFELMFEANPDWPADTGIMLRKRAHTFHGLQVLLDHRRTGAIGGFYGNGIGGWAAAPFAVNANYDAEGRPISLYEDTSSGTVASMTPEKRDRLTYAADVSDFLSTWRFLDWNEFRIRIAGAKPTAEVWINDLRIAAIDLAAMQALNYDAEAVADFLGPEGHIAFEVHDNDPGLGKDRWGRDACCRWRNIRIREL
ncbi:3-keto-disaccharide hydrolase [Devosia sp. SL43]|uniref:3-keto-disaccharide hydrolase n=1 Tax=Devosia sp. SL43 TaxID=2806348 RepID=UPI001F45616C|nr:DUF1080 domain-containing protein [Devosia sp. SL43]UJW86526.1 DUF1080 domain-containing protein [Devosia sp. SL43]